MNCSWRRGLQVAFGFVLTMGSLAPAFSAQEAPGDVVEFTPERWDLANARTVDHLGRKALMKPASSSTAGSLSIP